jgi:hypothetical protein
VYLLRDHPGYPWALTLFLAAVVAILIVVFALGPE